MTKKEIDLRGKVAFVTGAAQGIGRAVALQLSANGAHVFATDIQGGKLEELARQAEEAGEGGAISSTEMDVSRISDVEAAVAECTRQLGSPDIVINNAGVLHSTPVLQITESEWDHILDVNLKGAFFVAQKTLPHMIERRWGRIVNISSVAGRMGGYANGLAYSASKAGLIGLSHGLARRVAEHNVTVNAVAPGTTESEIIKQFTEDQKNALRSIIPLGRLGRVDDIAALVLFLSSDLASFITGAIIDINGGMYSG